MKSSQGDFQMTESQVTDQMMSCNLPLPQQWDFTRNKKQISDKSVVSVGQGFQGGEKGEAKD